MGLRVWFQYNLESFYPYHVSVQCFLKFSYNFANINYLHFARHQKSN